MKVGALLLACLVALAAGGGRRGRCHLRWGTCERMGGMRRYGADTGRGPGRQWVRDRACALTYKPWSKYPGVVPPSTSHLVYYFRPRVTATFGVSIDLGTTHWTEHNDVWLYCDGGFELRGRTYKRAEGFVKVYHNENGRSRLSFSVDHDRHAVATIKWKKGRRYKCIIGARSTQTTVYGISLFPCRRWLCTHRSWLWKHALRVCRFN